jgi:glycosyltransferase involved in cell wall biosynthesis
LDKNPRKEIRWIGKGADLVITANQDTQKYWQEQRIWPTDRVVFLPNFPVISSFPTQRPSKFTFIHLANYRAEKGQKLILNAVKILADQGIDFTVRFVGKVVDSKWRMEVGQLVQELGLGSRVSLEQEVGDVGSVLSEVHAGLIGSDREGLPVALLEYGLAGLSVVSTRVGQCPEVLNFGEFGLLADPADASGFANAMKQLIQNPEQAEIQAKSYQSHVLANYGAAGFMETYLKMI